MATDEQESIVRGARDLLVAAGFVVAVNAVGASPSLLVGADTTWFERPWFFPPEAAFPIVWTLLFALLGIALFVVWRGRRLRDVPRRDVRYAFVTFAVQFALNLAWTPVFFGWRRPGLALVVIVALWTAIVGTIVAFDRVDRRAALLLVPYLAWVTLAGVLNYAIWTG